MARRRSVIRSWVNRILHQGLAGYRIMYLDRGEGGEARLRPLEPSRIARVTGWAVYLDDGYTVIPLHRIVEIRDERGRVVWRRG